MDADLVNASRRINQSREAALAERRAAADEARAQREARIAGTENEWRRVTNKGRRNQFRPAQTAAVGERRRLEENVDDAGRERWEVPLRPRYRYRQAILQRNPDLDNLVDAIVEAVMATPTLAEHTVEDGPF